MFAEISILLQIAYSKCCAFEACVDKTAGWLPVSFSQFMVRRSVPHADPANAVHYPHSIIYRIKAMCSNLKHRN